MVWNREAFEQILIRELERKGLTAARWARDNGISPGTLHDIRFPKEGRSRKPSPAMALRLAEALGVPIGALTTGPLEAAS